MNLVEIIFSPTGGTKKVCEILAEEFQGEKRIIDLLPPDFAPQELELTPDDVCLIGVPSFGGRVPALAVEKLKQIKGNQAKAILVAAYGNRAYEDTLLELKDTAEECGFVCAAAIAAVAEHSIMRQFGNGRPDAQDKQELKQYAAQISKLLTDTKTFETLKVPGNHPYKEYGGLPFRPSPSKACNQCGVCASVCPAGAISKDNPKVTDKEKCITCMACVSACPQKARKMNAILLKAASKKMEKVCSGRKKNECWQSVHNKS